jgi:hypothetical protein
MNRKQADDSCLIVGNKKFITTHMCLFVNILLTKLKGFLKFH